MTIAQALLMSGSSMVVFIGGLIGVQLAPIENLATLPVASGVVGTAIAVVPVTQLMKHIGRRKSFLIIIVISFINALFTAYAVTIQHFYLFCLSALIYGITIACLMQFRFAAMESVSSELHAKAASTVLLGGIAAAFIGPESAMLGQFLFNVEFVGSFVLLAILFLIAFIVLFAFQNTSIIETSVDEIQRPLKTILTQFKFWVAILSATIGYAVMTFIMTATPVSMHHIDGHSLESTKWVIQSHILAMYLPSFFAAWIIRKLGLFKMMISGLISFILCIVITYAGHAVTNYWVGLVLLGIGWNFLFIGGTTLLPQVYRLSERFKVQSLNDFIVFTSRAIASLTAGWFVFSIGWEGMMLLTIPFILLLISILFVYMIKTKNNN